MTPRRFILQGEFIELNALLKLLSLAPSGGAAKAMIAAGTVMVDGVPESRIRRKLRAGNAVRVGSDEILVAGAGESP